VVGQNFLNGCHVPGVQHLRALVWYSFTHCIELNINRVQL
jgi:hypothetical protein